MGGDNMFEKQHRSLMAISIVAKKVAKELENLERVIVEEQVIELLGDDWRENPEYEFLT